uniref:Profilin n=1 Tax=Globodera pallida TaxID=36090 RepID=A0A183C1I5_GLOPA
MLAEFVNHRQASMAEDFVAFTWLTDDNGWKENGADEGYTPSGDYSTEEDLPSSDLEGADKWICQPSSDWEGKETGWKEVEEVNEEDKQVEDDEDEEKDEQDEDQEDEDEEKDEEDTSPPAIWKAQTNGFEVEEENEGYIPSGDLEGADKWTGHSLNFDGVYLTSDGQLVFVIGDEDGTQKRMLSYEEAIHTDMGGVCDFLFAKMQQKLAMK